MRDGDHPVLVAGLDPVGLAVAHRLHALGIPVHVLVTPDEGERHGAELAGLGVAVFPGSAAWTADLGRMDLAPYGAVVLAGGDEAAQVDACLIVRRRNGDVPLLVRVPDPTLVRFLRMTVPHVDVFSMGSVTAPVAADLAVHMLAAATAPQGRRGPHAKARPSARARRWRPSVTMASMLAISFAVALPAGAAFVDGRGGDPGRSAQFALSVLLGAGLEDVALARASETVRVAGLVLALCGKVAFACVIGLLLDDLLTRRFESVALRVPVRRRDHVVVVGAGNVGARVAELLHARKLPVVVIEASNAIRNVQRLRASGIAVVVGDATVDETLDVAGAWQAKVVLALTNSDAVNLHVALRMSDSREGVPVLVRLLSPELSAHVGTHANLTPVSPVFETAAHVCRAAERARADRMKARADAVAIPDLARTTGRFAGPEFDDGPTPAADVGAPEVPRAA
ncbi:MAG: hypothetical protein EXR79_14205 [Myxococcales bacterium]|nr:hypothetical protein [Myxococcales bacterium]